MAVHAIPSVHSILARLRAAAVSRKPFEQILERIWTLAPAPMTHSLDDAKKTIRQSVETYVEHEAVEESDEVTAKREVVVSSVRFRLQDKTTKYYGDLGGSHDKDEVHEEAVDLLKSLRGRANGVLLNFLSVAEMDFSFHPKFPNGDVSQRIEDVGGDFVGTLCKRAVVEVEPGFVI